MVPVSVDFPERLEDLPLPIGRAIFLTTQEALANIARHARAKKVNLSLNFADKRATLTVPDNGRGFDVTNESLRLGHGLANMQARAESLHGTFNIEATPSQGTKVVMSLPLCSSP